MGSRQQLRAEEIAALEKAIEILSGAAVSGNAEKHLPSLLQGAALAPLRDEKRPPRPGSTVSDGSEQAAQQPCFVHSGKQGDARPFRSGEKNDQGPAGSPDGGGKRGSRTQGLVRHRAF